MAGEDGVRDIEYLRGLEAAVLSGVEYGLKITMLGSTTPPRFPVPVLMQPRLAARHRIPLTLVLNRYIAAQAVLIEFVLKSGTELPDVSPPVLNAVLAAHNAALSGLVTAVSAEYEREEAALASNGRSQRAELIQRLLRAEPVDPSSLDYPFDGYHLGLVVLSPDPGPLLRALSKEVNARLLMTKAPDSTTWAWLGGKKPPDPIAVSEWAEGNWPRAVPCGAGEVTRSLAGWRRTHEQARAAASVAHLTSHAVAKYRDVALLATAHRDPLLLASMQDMYLDPLSQAGDRGEVLRATLRAFFDARRNRKSAGATLGVTRQTVSKDLKIVEGHLDQPIIECGDLLRAALQLEERGAFPTLDNC